MIPDNWSDDPITSRSDDLYARASYADRAAELITRSSSPTSSTVFGLAGPWGSGKSSLVAMIVETLVERDSKWKVVQFTPWATSDVAGLLSEFYSAVIRALPRRRKLGRQSRRALATLAQISAPAISAFPGAGKPIAETLKAGGQWLAKPTPWDKAFSKASKGLGKLRTQVLVVVDDIDRLDTSELAALFRVVRLLGRFPGVHYLLAYDERTLARSFSVGKSNEAGATFERFIEKIVQYPLVVPPLLPSDLLRLLEQGIQEVLAATQRDGIDQARLSKVGGLFPTQLWTPRGINRFLAQLRHHLPMIDQAEIDDVDVIMLTLVRVAFPQIYTELPAWRDRLLRGTTGKPIYTGSGVKFEPVDWKPLLGHGPSETQAQARGLLLELFPALPNDGMQSTRAPQRKRICHDDYFDRYFTMGIPRRDISDREVGTALETAIQGDPGPLRQLLLSERDPARLYLVIAKAREYSNSLQGPDRLVLVRELASCIDVLSERSTLILDPYSRVVTWMAQLISALDPAPSVPEVETALEPAALWTALAVWRDVMEMRGGDTAEWLQTVTRNLAAQATAAFLKNLRAGDNAPHDELAGWYRTFVTELRGPAQLKESVQREILAGDIQLSDLAARMVSLRAAARVGASSYLYEFDQEAWNQLAPAIDDSWYELPRVDNVDLSDTTWANRKLFAQGRATRPRQAAQSTSP